MDPNGNNHHRRQIITPHLSPPFIEGQTMLPLNQGFQACHNEMMNSSIIIQDLDIMHPLNSPGEEEIHVNVREELGQITYYNLPPQSLPLPDKNIQARYQLQFMNKVRQPTYATKPVRDNNGDPIRVQIYDSHTRSRVSPDCFLSSVKVRIIMLKADIWKNRVNWSRSEFVQNLLSGRAKEPILNSHGIITRLENGVGSFENLVFYDNSSWTGSGFRLGVMVDGEEDYNLTGERVQEGVSEPFQVKDRRTEASEKPKQLELTHSVKCIKKIGKDRASRLQKKGINTVEDFLRKKNNDEAALREILGIKSESGKEWVSIAQHLMQCDDKFQASVHPMERNMPVSTNGGCLLVGSGSTEPNPSENDIIEGQLSPILDYNSPLLNENGDSMQPTNGGLVVALGSSEPNPSGNDIIEGQLSPILNYNSPLLNENGDSMQPTNGGFVVGLGSSEPNSSENGIIEGQLFPTLDDISSFLNETGDSVQPTNDGGFPQFDGGAGAPW